MGMATSTEDASLADSGGATEGEKAGRGQEVVPGCGGDAPMGDAAAHRKRGAICAPARVPKPGARVVSCRRRGRGGPGGASPPPAPATAPAPAVRGQRSVRRGAPHSRRRLSRRGQGGRHGAGARGLARMHLSACGSRGLCAPRGGTGRSTLEHTGRGSARRGTLCGNAGGKVGACRVPRLQQGGALNGACGGHRSRGTAQHSYHPIWMGGYVCIYTGAGRARGAIEPSGTPRGLAESSVGRKCHSVVVRAGPAREPGWHARARRGGGVTGERGGGWDDPPDQHTTKGVYSTAPAHKGRRLYPRKNDKAEPTAPGGCRHC